MPKDKRWFERAVNTWWYKNCVKSRRSELACCDSCPFRDEIETWELLKEEEEENGSEKTQRR